MPKYRANRYGPGLTPGLAAKIVLRVARGLPIETVAKQLGIGESTIYQWSSARDNSELQLRLQFGIIRARAHREWHVLQRIERVAADDNERSTDRLKADMWLLERHPAYRDRFGIKVEHQTNVTIDRSLKAFEAKESTELLELAPGEFASLIITDSDSDS